MSTQALQSGVTYADVVRNLDSTVHVANSFRPEEVLKRSDRLVAPVRTQQTGIPQVDTFMGKANAAVDLTLSSVTDVPKAAIKGGLSGGIGGVVAGLAGWAFIRKSKIGGIPVPLWLGLLGGLGAMVGSAWTTAKEIFQKMGQMKDIVFY